jgi:hypothetical protein
MKFVRIGEDMIRLDMIVRISEGRVDETLYGRNVRKGVDREGWIEVHLLVGEAIKVAGPHADRLRSLLEEEYGVHDLTIATPRPPAAQGYAGPHGSARPAPTDNPYRTSYGG